MYIIVPDYRGAATLAAAEGEGVLADILALYSDATVVPVLNGPSPEEMRSIVPQVAKTDRLDPIVCEDADRGMVSATMTGYEYALDLRAEDKVVVKCDAAEHDINYIGVLAEAAREHGAVVGDLNFRDGDHLVKGTLDYHTHLTFFPTLYEGMTGGRLRLSCAHGFQAYRLDLLRKILPVARQIVKQVEKDIGQPMAWGLDGAMAVAATAVLGNIHVTQVPAQSVRNRPEEKIVAQLRKHTALSQAVAKLNLF